MRVRSGVHNINVKQGTQVTVTPDAIGNLVAEPQTFIWTGFTNVCHFVFSKDAGVYIQHVDGSLYTEEEWSASAYANNDANGVAVLSSDAVFVIAKQDVLNSQTKWGVSLLVNDIMTTSIETEAILDYDGISNTLKSIEQLKEITNSTGIKGAIAAKACSEFTFPNGKKGYLPALGEWLAVFNNKNAISSAISLIGGNSFIEYYWSSTQVSSDKQWEIRITSGKPYTEYKNNNSYLRAFTTL